MIEVAAVVVLGVFVIYALWRLRRSLDRLRESLYDLSREFWELHKLVDRLFSEMTSSAPKKRIFRRDREPVYVSDWIDDQTGRLI